MKNLLPVQLHDYEIIDKFNFEKDTVNVKYINDINNINIEIYVNNALKKTMSFPIINNYYMWSHREWYEQEYKTEGHSFKVDKVNHCLWDTKSKSEYCLELIIQANGASK